MNDKTSGPVRIFSVSTRFQEMAQRPGGLPREIAIERAEVQIEEFKAEFVDWVDRELAELTAAFDSATAQGGPDEAAIEAMYLRCRQLRDTGSTMGLELITFVADNLCQMIDGMRSGSAAYDPAKIECHIDALLLAKTEPYRNMDPDQVFEMIDGLLRVRERAHLRPATEAQ